MMRLEDDLSTARKFLPVAPTNATNTPSLSGVHPACAGALYPAPPLARNRVKPPAVRPCMLRSRDCSTRKVHRRRTRTVSHSVSEHITLFPSLSRRSKVDLVVHADSTSLGDELPREVVSPACVNHMPPQVEHPRENILDSMPQGSARYDKGGTSD